MSKKYSLKLDGRFAGRYEIFTETEIIWLRMYFHDLKRDVSSPFNEGIIDKMLKVLEIRTVDE